VRTLCRCISWLGNHVQVTNKGYSLVCQRIGPLYLFSKTPPSLCLSCHLVKGGNGRNQSKNTTLECMVKNFKNGFNGDYGVNSTPNKPKVLL
jgi:hypothetical protein